MSRSSLSSSLSSSPLHLEIIVGLAKIFYFAIAPTVNDAAVETGNLRGGLKNPDILIRGVSRRRLDDRSRNIRAAVGTVAGRDLCAP